MWIESDLFVEHTTEHLMAGKDYAKWTRAPKITLQTMWQLLLSQLLSYIQQRDVDHRRRLMSLARLDTTAENYENVVTILKMETFREHDGSFCGNEQEIQTYFFLAEKANGSCSL